MAPRAFSMNRGLLKGLNFFIDPRKQSLLLTWLYELRDPFRRGPVRGAGADGGGRGRKRRPLYTVYFAAQPGIQAVFACEPNLDSVRLLERNLALNPPAMAGKVNVKPICVGRESRPPASDLDSLLKDSAGPFFFKIDVEGAELEVLSGARATLRDGDSMLVVETHSTELEAECVRFLESLGYRCEIRKIAWYRRLLPELRPIPHNRWLVAERPGA
ncbi:MAG: FkbM family methyltransferase [Acidobacteriota bacterium]|nr:FkbM family methyltransferase [Acidobacteriota bacterium]